MASAAEFTSAPCADLGKERTEDIYTLTLSLSIFSSLKLYSTCVLKPVSASQIIGFKVKGLLSLNHSITNNEKCKKLLFSKCHVHTSKRVRMPLCSGSRGCTGFSQGKELVQDLEGGRFQALDPSSLHNEANSGMVLMRQS
jgi:hypothetical protein